MQNCAPDEEVSGPTAPAPGAGQAVSAQCYAEMRRVARRLLKGDRARFSFQPTDLAHDALLRLIQSDAARVNDPAHMLALGARTMRRVLIDEARRSSSVKRHMPTLVPVPFGEENALIDVEVLDDALNALSAISADHATVVELRFTLGMTVEEAAEALGIAPRTVKRRWQSARAWLHTYLTEDAPVAAPGA